MMRPFGPSTTSSCAIAAAAATGAGACWHRLTAVASAVRVQHVAEVVMHLLLGSLHL